MLYNFLLAKYVLVYLGNPTASFRRFFILGQATTNIIALPLVLITSICSQMKIRKPGYLLDQLLTNASITDDDIFFSQTECSETGDFYLLMYGLLIIFFTWTVGVQYVQAREEHEVEKVPDAAPDHETQETEIPSQGTGSPQEVEKVLKEVVATTQDPEESLPIGLRCRTCATSLGKQFLRPINLSQIGGVFIGLVSPIQGVLFNETGFLKPVMVAVEVFAAATVSIVNMIMACSLSLKLQQVETVKDLFGNEAKLGISRRTLFVYAFSRMVFVPGFTFALFWLIETYLFTFVPEDDKLMKLVVYLELFTPTANLIVVLAQIVEQRENSEILAMGGLLQYFIGLFSVTGYTFLTILHLDLLD